MTEQARPKEPQGGEIFLPDNVSLHMFFTRHASAEDLGDLDIFRRIRESDIFILENPGWTHSLWGELNDVSSGDVDVLRKLLKGQSSYSSAVLTALFDSHVKVELIDIDAFHLMGTRSLYPRFEGGVNLEGKTLQEIAEMYDDYYARFAPLEFEREGHILRTIGPRLKAGIDTDDRLKAKEKVNVLMIYGADHDRLFDKLRQEVVSSPETGLPEITKEYSTAFDPESIFSLSNYLPSGLPREERVRIIAERMDQLSGGAIRTDDNGGVILNIQQNSRKSV